MIDFDSINVNYLTQSELNIVNNVVLYKNVKREFRYHVSLKRPQTAVKMKLTGIFERQNVIRPKWFGFDNVVEYKLDNLIQP